MPTGFRAWITIIHNFPPKLQQQGNGGIACLVAKRPTESNTSVTFSKLWRASSFLPNAASAWHHPIIAILKRLNDDFRATNLAFSHCKGSHTQSLLQWLASGAEQIVMDTTIQINDWGLEKEGLLPSPFHYSLYLRSCIKHSFHLDS